MLQLAAAWSRWSSRDHKILAAEWLLVRACHANHRLKTPAPAQTLKQINKKKLADTVPKAVWQDFHPPRGEEVYIFNETYQTSTDGQLRQVSQMKWSNAFGVLCPV